MLGPSPAKPANAHENDGLSWPHFGVATSPRGQVKPSNSVVQGRRRSGPGDRHRPANVVRPPVRRPDARSRGGHADALDLHAWVYTNNPTGELSAWNPNITCPTP